MRNVVLCLMLFVCISALTLSAYGATLSPGLAVLAARSGMAVSAPSGEEIRFHASDFTAAVGGTFSTLTVTKLPPSSNGTLFLGALAVEEGQVIPFSLLSDLVFSPENKELSEAAFCFRTGEHYEFVCRMCFLTENNHAPKIIAAKENLTVWTQCDLPADGILSGYDPDGDIIRFEIVKQPENGLLKLTDQSLGAYVYTPYASAIGFDSFSYRICDSYGQYSETVTVSVSVNKPFTDIAPADLAQGSAYNAAAVMLAGGYMEGKVKGGSIYFEPEEAVSRETFLMTVMNVLGAENLPSVSSTVFADDSDISAAVRPYVFAAYRLGIITGSTKDHQLYFRPQEPVTQTEAAAIISRIVGMEGAATAVFASEEAVPAWAQNAASTVCHLGIMSENHFLTEDQTVTRGEAAVRFLKLLELTGQI